MSIRERIVKGLGGYTKAEYDQVCRDGELRAKEYRWVKDALGYDLHMFQKRVDSETLNLRAVANLERGDGRAWQPVDYVERELARKMVIKLMDSGLVKFGVEDERATGGRLYVADLTVVK